MASRAQGTRGTLSRMRRAKALILGLGAFACSSAPPASHAPGGARPVTISVFASNDVHGQLERLPILAGFATNLRRARERDGAVLLVDAGDAFQGTIESNSNEGAAVIAAYNAMGYRTFALGNHEFDFGPMGPKALPEALSDDPQGALKARLTEARFPVLSANLRDEHDALPAWTNLGASTLLDVAGVRVGVIGLITADAKDVIKRPLFRQLHVAPLANVAVQEARSLRRRGAEVVIIVAHAGGACADNTRPLDLSSCEMDSEIFRVARAFPPSGVDAIIGGHRNATVAHVVNGIPVVHAPSNLVAFSRVDIVYDRAKKTVVERRVSPPHALCARGSTAACDPGEYEGAKVVAEPAVASSVAPALDSARAVRAQPVGVHVEAPFSPSKGTETALGNLFADLMREAVPKADAAFANAGSLRDVLPEGDLTLGQLYHVMPFDNQLALLKMSGAELRALIRQNVTQREHGLLSISGIRVHGKCENGHLVLDLSRSDGTPLRDDEKLTVATSDFLAWGGDGLLPAIRFPETRVELISGNSVLDVLRRGLARRRSIRPDDPALLDPKHPRIDIPRPPPVGCL